MTQTETKKKTCYPQGRILVTRECIKAICLDNSPAAKLLSVLMYWYDHSSNEAVNGLFTVVRSQAALVQDTCEEITEKTIHDTAGPFLQVLGFLDIEERIGGNRYTLHIDHIHEALRLYGEERSQLENFLISILQLEKFLIDPKGVIQLEKVRINRKNLQLQLEKVRIANRKSSNCQRGRKPSPKAPSDGQKPPLENKREFLENSNERKEKGPPPSPSPEDSSFISSDLNSKFSQEDAQPFVPDPTEDSANAKPESFAPPIATDVHNEHHNTSRDGQGYKTEHSSTAETPDSDALVEMSQQSVMKNSTVTQNQLLEWCLELKIRVPRSRDMVTQHCTKLLALVKRKEDVQRLRDIAAKKHPDVALGNLANDDVVREWQEAASEQAQNELVNERLDKEQANEFAQWLMRERGFSWDVVAIDSPYRDPNIWVLCVRYGDQEGDWLRIRNWWHYCHLEDWEQELYALASGYNDLQQPDPESAQQREAVAV